VSVLIEGVEVENPTAVWMQLTNTRRQVLQDKKFWNDSGWYRGKGEFVDDKGKFTQVPTMCLANAIRFVTFGRKGQNKAMNGAAMDVAETLVLATINRHFKHLQGEVSEIPSFNDQQGRRYEEIAAVLDKAIELVEPFARTWAFTIAEEVMTRQEREEIDDAIRKQEDLLWSEWRKGSARKDKQGRWRKNGKFVKAPKWEKKMLATPKDVTRFKGDLKDLDQRGWDTFWTELTACPDDDLECQERAKQFA
jgi:hypothetical protein